MKELIILNLPNIVTLARICLVPVIVWTMLVDEFFISFILFVIAGISDFVDGWIARMQNIQTILGSYLDPLADKLLMGSVYLTLGILGHIPGWLVVAVIFRDLLIIGAVILAWIIERPVHISPLMVSKINTLMQIGLAILVLGDLGLILQLASIREMAYLFVVATTIISTFAYLVVWVKTVSEET